MRDHLQGRLGADVKLVESGGGVFEIMADGKLVFSKKQLGRFPTNDEIEQFGSE